MSLLDKYTNKILAMSDQGLSSKEIAIVLSETTDDVHRDKDRCVRRILNKHRENYSERTEPHKIFLFDIETAPLVSYLWNRFQKYISDEMIIEDWYVICWSGKWLFKDEMISHCVTSEESINRNDERITKHLWNYLNEADIVISHNGDKFDIKKINGRFSKYGLNLPMPYQSIDTFKAARKKLSLPSLSLDYIASHFGLEGKHDTGFDLWVKCMQGDEKALDRMQKYCDQDIRVLEDVYLNLRPYIQPHPNLGLFIESDSQMCPSCASTNLKKEGTYATTVNLYDAFRCQDCGSITRSRNTSVPLEDKKNITSSVPR